MLVNIKSEIFHPKLKQQAIDAFPDEPLMHKHIERINGNRFIPTGIEGIMYSGLNPHLETPPTINVEQYLNEVVLKKPLDKRNRKFRAVVRGRKSQYDTLPWKEQKELSYQDRVKLSEQQSNKYYFSSNGVCDNPQQVYSHYKFLQDQDDEYCIFLTPIYKEHQPSDGGWRWHKWGEYIGKKKQSGCEYLYDEPDIDLVFVYSVCKIIRNKVVYTLGDLRLIEDYRHWDVVDSNDVTIAHVKEDKESKWYQVGFHTNPYFYSQSDDAEDILKTLQQYLES